MKRWLIWNVLFRLHEAAKQHPTYRFLREMEAAESLSTAGLRELQCRKLQDLILYGYTHVPYVRARMDEGGMEPGSLRTPEDLARLPIMRKADVRQHREQLRSDISGKLASFTTGGS